MCILHFSACPMYKHKKTDHISFGTYIKTNSKKIRNKPHHHTKTNASLFSLYFRFFFFAEEKIIQAIFWYSKSIVMQVFQLFFLSLWNNRIGYIGVQLLNIKFSIIILRFVFLTVYLDIQSRTNVCCLLRLSFSLSFHWNFKFIYLFIYFNMYL